MTDEIQRKAIIYCRVSSAKQLKVGDGLNSQETRCREFARMKGYVIVAVFGDDASGSTIDRPGMKEALAYVREHKGENIILLIDDVSRLARGVEQHLQLRSLIAAAGATLESPSIEFGEDSDSLLVENLLASVSQHQRQKNGEQTRNRMRARVMNGFWPFQAPVGYKHKRASGGGMILTRDEPAASVVQEAFEKLAAGHLETQAEVGGFLQDNPLFPKDSRGIVRHQRVSQLLRNPVYAGLVEAKKWDVSLRKGQHEGIVSLETFQRVQERLDGNMYVPRRRNVNEDFPLRGFVVCDDCSTPLTACWSKGSHGRYPYYLCPKRGCDSYGKSIKRDKLEGEFETLLKSVQPTETLFRVARKMFKDLWDAKIATAHSNTKAMDGQIAKIEREVDKLLERIVDASVPSVIAAYEDKVRRLESEKMVLKERAAKGGRPASSFDSAVRTALDFLSSPWNLWCSERLEDRRTVIKLTFADRLRYHRNSGLRTANLSLPFKVLGAFESGENRMARPKRFELLTPRFVVWCSIQLSYGRADGWKPSHKEPRHRQDPARAA
jgi:site-specific DNA recombinase